MYKTKFKKAMMMQEGEIAAWERKFMIGSRSIMSFTGMLSVLSIKFYSFI